LVVRFTVGPGDVAEDATAMAARLSAQRGARILYLCGRLRRPAFEDTLGKAGVLVTPLETYDTLSIDYTPDEIAAHIGHEPVDGVLVYSAEAAIALLRLIKSVVPHLFGANTCFLCISPRVAALLAGQHLKTLAAPEPTESSLISALRDISSAGS